MQFKKRNTESGPWREVIYTLQGKNYTFYERDMGNGVIQRRTIDQMVREAMKTWKPAVRGLAVNQDPTFPFPGKGGWADEKPRLGPVPGFQPGVPARPLLARPRPAPRPSNGKIYRGRAF